jgi:hypothetical protein
MKSFLKSEKINFVKPSPFRMGTLHFLRTKPWAYTHSLLRKRVKHLHLMLPFLVLPLLPSLSKGAATVYDAGVKLKDGSQTLRLYRRVEQNATFDGDLRGPTGYNWANTTSQQTNPKDREMCMAAPELVD